MCCLIYDQSSSYCLICRDDVYQYLLLQNSGSGSALFSISRQLIDGHWVLSFASPQQAQYAQDMVQQHSARLRTLYGEALLPMLTSPQML